MARITLEQAIREERQLQLHFGLQRERSAQFSIRRFLQREGRVPRSARRLERIQGVQDQLEVRVEAEAENGSMQEAQLERVQPEPVSAEERDPEVSIEPAREQEAPREVQMVAQGQMDPRMAEDLGQEVREIRAERDTTSMWWTTASSVEPALEVWLSSSVKDL